MLKYVNYDIVFQEFPDEVTLAINLSLCPNGCPGCHSAYLKDDIGEELTEERLFALLDDVEGEVTCVGLMGGDNAPAAVGRVARAVKRKYGDRLKTGWYSGRDEWPTDRAAFNYVKLGPYRAEQGPLKSPTTNQRLYRQSADGTFEDITRRFWQPA